MLDEKLLELFHTQQSMRIFVLHKLFNEKEIIFLLWHIVQRFVI